MDIRFLLLQLCFFVSGFAALVYETAWTRELSFVFGTSELAVSAVLAAYMAGLALGAAVAARIVARIRRPVLVYGLLELGIAAAALAVPFAIQGVMRIYLGWLGGLSAPPETMGLTTALFHLAGSFVVLVPCTALMGATLPLLARHAVHSDEQIGPRIGLLYAVNTAGAICGTLVTAYLLLPELGLRRCIYVGALANGVVFLAAAALARTVPPRAESAPDPTSTSGVPLILPLMAVSGFTSFAYEVLWARMLGYVLGASTAAFATMLASFLLGIALGSAAASRFARSRSAAATGFVIAQIGAAVGAWSAYQMADRLPEFAMGLSWTGGQLPASALASVLVMLPFTLCIGATFPFGVRLLAEGPEAAARASGRVYAWNTVGSIGGSIGAGFFLLPMLGLEGTLVVGVFLNLLLAAAAAAVYTGARHGLMVGGAALVAAVGLLLSPPGPPIELLRGALGSTERDGALSFLAVGRSATVTLFETPPGWRLATNGLPESTIERAGNPRDRYQPSRWLALLPTLVRPETRDMLMIGLGGGATLGSIPPSLEAIDVIELEPEVVAANRFLSDVRLGGDPLADPRVNLLIGDARGALMLADARYEAIVSQPSHPWTSGASHLYTRDFFSLVRSRLSPDGIFVQWIGLAFVDTDLLRSLLATLNDVFPHVEVYRPFGSQGILFAASARPVDLRESVPRALELAPVQLGQVGLYGIEDVIADCVLDAETTRRISSDAPLITDDHNRLATSAYRLGDPAVRRRGIERLLKGNDALAERLDGLDPALLMRTLMAEGGALRAQVMANRLSGGEREMALGWVLYDAGNSKKAALRFAKALELSPGMLSAASGLAITRPALVGDFGLPERVRAVSQGMVALSTRDMEKLRLLDDVLAEWPAGSLLFREAVRLRVAWRVGEGTPERAQEALDLMDVLLTRKGAVSDYLARAEAARLAGRPDPAWASLVRVSEKLNGDPSPMQRARRALTIAEALGEYEYADEIESKLQRAAEGR
jgi:spermidine synthase